MVQIRLNRFFSKKQVGQDQAIDPCQDRQTHIKRIEEILKEYPQVPLSSLISKYTVESGKLRATVEDYFRVAVKRLKAQGINREWG